MVLEYEKYEKLLRENPYKKCQIKFTNHRLQRPRCLGHAAPLAPPRCTSPPPTLPWPPTCWSRQSVRSAGGLSSLPPTPPPPCSTWPPQRRGATPPPPPAGPATWKPSLDLFSLPAATSSTLAALRTEAEPTLTLLTGHLILSCLSDLDLE